MATSTGSQKPVIDTTTTKEKVPVDNKEPKHINGFAKKSFDTKKETLQAEKLNVEGGVKQEKSSVSSEEKFTEFNGSNLGGNLGLNGKLMEEKEMINKNEEEKLKKKQHHLGKQQEGKSGDKSGEKGVEYYKNYITKKVAKLTKEIFVYETTTTKIEKNEENVLLATDLLMNIPQTKRENYKTKAAELAFVLNVCEKFIEERGYVEVSEVILGKHANPQPDFGTFVRELKLIPKLWALLGVQNGYKQENYYQYVVTTFERLSNLLRQGSHYLLFDLTNENKELYKMKEEAQKKLELTKRLFNALQVVLDFELPRDVVYFCQPEGAVSYTGSGFHQLRKRNLFNEATSFVFMLTEKDTAKVRYGLSHHPFLSAFRDLMHLFRHLADCCNYRANLDESLPRDAVWTVLAGHWPQGMSIPMPVMQELRQLETWLFTLLSSPVPVPGNTKLLLEVLPSDMMPTPLEFALPDYTRFSLVDFPLHLPLELLGVEAVMQILAAIMLEYKVVLQSRNYNAVSMCVMALVAMLYPLEYMFPVIPLLPAFMPSAEQLLLAPTPFIIGLPASFFHFKGIQIPSDVLLADLDTNRLIMPSDQSVRIPQFPEYEASILREEFLRAMGKHPTEGHELLENGIVNSTIDGDEIDVKCRVAMIHFYSGPNVFANFSEHTRTIRLYPRPVVALQVDSFLRSRGQNNEFISELCKTQAVEYFAECSLCPPNETYVRIQTGVISPEQIGDKAKWFSDSLMPVHFNAYPYGSTLSEAIFLSRIDKSENLLERNNSENLDDDAESEFATTATSSDLESVGSVETGGAWSPFGSRSPLNLDISKPLSDACDIYQAPNRLELPKSESKMSIDSSDISSCRSSPLSGDFTFANSGHATDEETTTVCENSSSILTNDSTTSLPLNGSQSNLSSSSSTTKNNLKNNRPLAIMNKALNSGQGVFDQMMKKGAPKAAQAMAKALPLAEAVSNRVMEEGRGLLNRTAAKHSNEYINDSMSINNEAMERLRKLRERENAAAAQQQSNFNMADSQLGLASAFHVLEIAHTHYWTPLQQSQTPSGGGTLNSVTDGIKSLVS
uniref:MAP kinase-activating death domain protein n=1 Tax=Meloidogyne javanica TaxID=6303 RepID=A0A915M8L6_MELJA